MARKFMKPNRLQPGKLRGCNEIIPDLQSWGNMIGQFWKFHIHIFHLILSLALNKKMPKLMVTEFQLNMQILFLLNNFPCRRMKYKVLYYRPSSFQEEWIGHFCKLMNFHDHFSATALNMIWILLGQIFLKSIVYSLCG